VSAAATTSTNVEGMTTTMTTRTTRGGRRAGRTALGLVAALAAMLLLIATPARAEFGIASFDGSVTDAGGATFTQAGGHAPNVTTAFTFNLTPNAAGTNLIPDGQVKDIEIDLPPGLIGDPTALPRCSRARFAEGANTTCPPASQVGTNTLLFNRNPTTGQLSGFTAKVFNLVPRPGTVAQFGFRYLTNTITIEARVRPDDHGITMRLRNLPQALGLMGNSTTFWGVPADLNGGGWSRSPFLTLPTSCLGPQVTTMRATSWPEPDEVKTASFVSHDPLGNLVGGTGCDRLPFDPTITAQPDTTVANSPTGLSVDVRVPQDANPDGLATAHLKNAVVRLPAGVSLSPSSANGLVGCSQAQIGLGNDSEPSCPAASKIGTVEIDTPVLENPMRGAIYAAQQGNLPGHGSNPFGSLLAIYVTAAGDGVQIKLAAKVEPDPVTGQLTTTFADNPQLPFDHFKLNFFGGPGAVLATPERCGSYETTASFEPWSGTPAVSSRDGFAIGSGCVSGFSPSFKAGVADPTAAGSSPFTLSFSRADTDEGLASISAELPTGLLAKLKGVPLCPDAQAATGACPADSQVGTVTVGSGPGPNPVFLPGRAFLTGPYKGAPYGLAIVVRAVAGPFDLGTVVVRQALHIDPTDAHVTVVSDPFPTILQGIPLRMRRVDVTMDRPGFMLNPSDCSPKQIRATIRSTEGTSAGVASRFQAANCAALAFKPRIALQLVGRKQTKTDGHPALRARVRQRGTGEAAIENAAVRLPRSLALDPDNARALCEFEDGTRPDLENHCPRGSIVGRARATTPLLNRDLVGDVYFVKNVRIHPRTGRRIRTMPMLVAALRGEIAINLTGKTSVDRRSRLVTTFAGVPDAPITQFNMDLKGGRTGILTVTGTARSDIDLCRAGRQIAEADTDGHNGKRRDFNVVVRKPCPKVKRNRARANRRNARS
jgi:hypothetical protein